MKRYECLSFEKSNSNVFTYKIIKAIYNNKKGFINTFYCRIYNYTWFKIIFKLTYRLVGNVNKTRLVIILNHLKSNLVGLEGSGLLAVFNTFTYVIMQESRTWIYLLKGDVRNMLYSLTVVITSKHSHVVN